MTTDTPLFALRNVSKVFPGVKALDDVQLELYPGQVTALVGENGAGKSTLVKTMTGIYQPEAGDIWFDGEVVSFPNPEVARQMGITAIHQETVLFDELSVAENIFVGSYPTKGWLKSIDWPTMNERAQAILDEIEAPLSPTAQLKGLSIGQKHMVAIARALSVKARVVILDEPTAALSHHEIQELYEIIERLKASGTAILFITHKFDEIIAVADRYTVFRDGRYIGAGSIKDVTEPELVEMMVARSVKDTYPKVEAEFGDTVFKVENLSHPTEFDDISFDVRRGEILGLYGLVGAGRTEIMKAIIGLSPKASGQIYLDGQPISIRSPAEAIHHGIVYVPEERQQQGVMLDLPIYQNISLPQLHRTSKGGFLRPSREYELTQDYAKRLNVKTSNWSEVVNNLSGGNQQKVVIAKWLATDPKVIILDEPTKGIDIGSKAAVHQFMSELVQQGLAVIMVSSELPEVMGMADRIIVMHEGLITQTLSRSEASAERIVSAATGGQS